MLLFLSASSPLLPRTGEIRFAHLAVTEAHLGKRRVAARASLKPEHVGIAGAGIAGLSAALALLKTEGTGVKKVTLFEPRTSLDIGLGGALNMNSGAAVLTRCYGLGPKLWEIGNPLRNVRSVVADGTREGGGVLLEVDVAKTVRRTSKSRELLVDDAGQVLTMTVMRDQLQQLLVDELPANAFIQRGKRVAKVVPETSGKYRFEFEDGSLSAEDFDLVLGCDGLRSVVRRYIAPSNPLPVYSGIQIQFAVTSPRPADPCRPPGMLRQYFGDGAYTLYYTAGGKGNVEHDLLAVVFAAPEKVDENAGYEQGDLREECGRRMRAGGIVQDLPMECFDRAERFVQVGVYYHKQLSSWSDADGGVVLVGDAAHAMPPFLGAGAGQAIQDGHALATAIARIGDTHKDLCAAVKSYEKSRQPATNAILQTSRLIGFLETQGGLGAKARNVLFRALNVTGVAGQVYVTSATPTIDM
jgi:2-polyprenyl-6-methoxyphenol hydroxylase-like FAD-dependent oxidoreductase